MKLYSQLQLVLSIVLVASSMSAMADDRGQRVAPASTTVAAGEYWLVSIGV